MIICPQCETENADNANHCGNCGARLQKGGSQKTMFGFAAVSPDALEEAAKEAKQAREAARKGDDRGAPPADEPARPKIPKPTGAAGGGVELPKTSKIDVPKPGQSVPEPSESPRDEFGLGDTVPPGSQDRDLQLEGMQPRDTVDEPAPAAPVQNMPQQADPTEPEWKVPGVAGASNASTPGADAAGSASDDGWGDPVSAPTGSSSNDGWEDSGASTAQEAASDGWGEPPSDSLPQQAPAGNLQAAQGFGASGGQYERGEVRNPVVVLLLGFVTCGIYAMYWFFAFMQDLNGGVGEERFNPIKEIALTFVTCGIWGYWLMWRMAEATVETQQKWGVSAQMEPVVLFVVTLFGLGPIFLQGGLNNAWENGNPPA